MKTVVILLLTLSVLSCHKILHNRIREKGVVERQGITTYQYGSHVLIQDNKRYILVSDRVDLDQHLNQEVTILAKRIDASELPENGPDLYEVKRVRE